MPALGPRLVEPDAWGEWVRESVRLLVTRPAQTMVILALVLLVFYAVHLLSWEPVRRFMTLLCIPIGLMIFIRLAWFMDHGKRARLYQLLPGNSELLLAVGCAAAVMALHGALSAMLDPMTAGFRELVQQLGLWSPVRPDGLPAEPPLRQTLLGPILVPGGLFGAALAGMLLMLLAFGQWFLLPMMALHQPPLPPAMASGARAYHVNPVPMLGLTGVLMLSVGFLVVTLGWALVGLVPFFGALLYVSYRDVFLGKEADAPEVVEDEEAEAQMETDFRG